MGSKNVSFTLTSIGRARRMLAHPEQAAPLHKEAIVAAEMQAGKLSDDALTGRYELATDERDAGQFDDSRRDAELALSGFSQTLPPTHRKVSDSRYLVAQLDYLQGRCTASSLLDLEAAWEQRRGVNKPTAHWREAEAGLLMGLCGRQMNKMDHVETSKLIERSARELLDSQMADPYFKRIARDVVAVR